MKYVMIQWNNGAFVTVDDQDFVKLLEQYGSPERVFVQTYQDPLAPPPPPPSEYPLLT